MKCPGCGAQVAAGTAICPKCDNILDTSFLSDSAPEPAPSAADATQPRAQRPKPPPGRPPTGSAKAARPPSGAQRSVGRPPTRGGAKPVSRTASAGADESTPPRGTKHGGMPEAPQRVIAAQRGKVDYAALDKEYGQEHAPPPPAFKAERMTGADEALDEAKQFLGSLSPSDKLAIVGAALFVLSAFLPWKVTAQEGEVLGIVSLGAVATVAAILSIVAIYVRVKKLRPEMNPIIPWLGQLGSLGFGIVWCLIFIRISWDGTIVPSVDGNIQVAASKPDTGVVIALSSGIISLVGTLMGLKDQRL